MRVDNTADNADITPSQVTSQ